MALKKIVVAMGLFVIGLLFIELGLFCYSFYDPSSRFSQYWFPYRGWGYLPLLLGAMALFLGTAFLVEANKEE